MVERTQTARTVNVQASVNRLYEQRNRTIASGADDGLLKSRELFTRDGRGS